MHGLTVIARRLQPCMVIKAALRSGNWESGEELGDTWASRNAFSYGRRAPQQAAPAAP